MYRFRAPIAVVAGGIEGASFFNLDTAYKPANKPIAEDSIYPSTPVSCPAKNRLVFFLSCKLKFNNQG